MIQGVFVNFGGKIKDCMTLACFYTQVWKERYPRFCVYRRADEGKHREHPEVKLHQVVGKDARTIQSSLILHNKKTCKDTFNTVSYVHIIWILIYVLIFLIVLLF